MGSEKRERQKANRAARLEQEAKIAKRKRYFRAARTFGIAAAVVFGAAILISLLSGSDSGDATTTTATTTAPGSTTTTAGATTSLPDAGPAATNYELFAGQDTACGAERPPPPVTMTFDAPEDQGIDPGAMVTAVIATSCGDITLDLDPAAAPETVNSFVFLAREGYFDGTAMHRISPGFVIQGGDPTASGFGGPGYSLNDELPPAGTSYDQGVLAMANSGADTAGSQFFITVADTGLDPDFTIFGRVDQGQETLDAITAVPLGLNSGGEQSRPLQSIYIESVTVTVG